MRIILIFIIFLNIHQTKATEFYIGTSNSEGIYHSQINLSNGNLSPFKLVASLKRPSFLSIDYEYRRINRTNLDLKSNNIPIFSKTFIFSNDLNPSSGQFTINDNFFRNKYRRL